MEMKAQDSNVKANSGRAGWGQLSSLNSSPLTSCSSTSVQAEELVQKEEPKATAPQENNILPIEGSVVLDPEAQKEEPKATAPQELAPRDLGALVFHRRKDQKNAEFYQQMEQYFPGVCPELPRPALLDGTHAGDYGFDPAGFCTTNAELYNQMEAEVRHCRLAMLCAAGWPMAELWGQDWFDGYFLADGGRAPSILNGGLIWDTEFPPLPTLAVLGFFFLYGQQELKTIGTLKSQTLYGNVHKKDLEGLGEEWPWGVAGDEDFDPLGLYGLLGNDAIGRFTMRELELNHGRVAMLAVLAYVMIESVTHTPIVRLTPFLFGQWYW